MPQIQYVGLRNRFEVDEKGPISHRRSETPWFIKYKPYLTDSTMIYYMLGETIVITMYISLLAVSLMRCWCGALCLKTQVFGLNTILLTSF